MKPMGTVLLCGLCLGLAGCTRGESQAPKQETTAAPQTVAAVKVESQKLDSTMALPAQIVPYRIVDIYPRVTGFIESMRVDRGSRVRRGEIMARLAAPELVAQKAQAESNLRTAQAQLAAAQAKLISDQGTYQHLAAAAKTPGVVAGNDLAVAEQTANADRAQVEAASNTVKAAREALRGVSELEGYLEVRAPFDGVVTQRNLHPGALVGPSSGQAGSQPMVQIEDVARLRLVVPVPESYVGGVSDGQKVSFTVPAYPGRHFQAPIARSSHNVSQTTRTMAVELEIRNPEAAITPGTFASVEWPIRRSYPTLVVPASAITTDLQRTFVIRIRDGKAEWIDVTTGITANGKTEVFGQLQPGDTVVKNATDAIRAGTPLHAQGS
jgi:membrane fusion protein, multidrug efflux system